MTGLRAWLWTVAVAWVALAGFGLVVAIRAASGQAHATAYSEAQARSGLLVFAENCASCHGPDMAGGASAPALVGDAFWDRWGGRPVSDLYGYIHDKMPLGRGGSLDTEAYLAATAVVLWANALPPGHRPLEPHSDVQLSRDAQGERPARIAPEVPGAPALLGRWTTSSARRPEARKIVAQPADGVRSTPGTGGEQTAPDATGPEAEDEGATDEGATDEGATDEGATNESATDETSVDEASTEESSTDEGTASEGGDTPDASEDAAQTSESGRSARDPGDAIAGVVLDGARLYQNHCHACHGPGGAGGFGPPLATNPRLEDPDWVIRRVLVGGRGMPPFHRTLVPSEVAAVVSHVRTSFGNDEGAVDAERVREVLARLEPTLPSVRGAGLEDAPLGEQRYAQLCSACHGLEGGGDVGPPLAGNPALQSDQLVITRILYGRDVMPAYAHHSNTEIAAIASYIRTAWSNAYGPIDAPQVEAFRPDANVEGENDVRTRPEARDAQ